MLEEMTAEQYAGWLSYLRKYHPTADRNDPYFAMLTAAVINKFADKEDQVRPIDLMIYHDRFEEDLTLEELLLRCGVTQP